MKQTFEFTDEEVLTIVTALGVLKSRIGQRERWLQRKRMVTLRGRLADCITIGDETEADGVRKAMAITKKKISSAVRTSPTSTECCGTSGEIVATRSPTCKSNWKSDTLN